MLVNNRPQQRCRSAKKRRVSQRETYAKVSRAIQAREAQTYQGSRRLATTWMPKNSPCNSLYRAGDDVFLQHRGAQRVLSVASPQAILQGVPSKAPVRHFPRAIPTPLLQRHPGTFARLHSRTLLASRIRPPMCLRNGELWRVFFLGEWALTV